MISRIICFYLAIATLGFIQQGCKSLPTHYMVGNQVWMSKNADVDKFRNGDNITYAKSYEMWQNLTKTMELCMENSTIGML